MFIFAGRLIPLSLRISFRRLDRELTIRPQFQVSRPGQQCNTRFSPPQLICHRLFTQVSSTHWRCLKAWTSSTLSAVRSEPNRSLQRQHCVTLLPLWPADAWALGYQVEEEGEKTLQDYRDFNREQSGGAGQDQADLIGILIYSHLICSCNMFPPHR